MKGKHFILSLIVLASNIMSAQELTFYLGDNKIEPNSTVYFNEISIEDTGNGVDYRMAPKIYLVSEKSTADATVKAHCSSGQRIQLCAGGSCQTGVTVEKNDISLTEGEKLDIQFECIGFTLSAEEKIPTVTTEISARIGYDETKFTIMMNNPSGSIDSILEGEENFDIYDMNGVCLFRNSTSETLKEKLSKGIYLIKSVKGKTRKIFIN